MSGEQRFEPFVKGLLGLGIFINRLDDNIGMGQLGVAHRAVDQRGQLQRLGNVRRLRFAVVARLAEDALHAAADGFGCDIAQGDGNSPLDVGGGDALPHYACANNAHGSNFARNSLACADLFVLVAEKKNVQQGSVDGRTEQGHEAFGLHFARGIDVHARGGEHHLQGGKRGRIMTFSLTLNEGAGRGAEKA
jgi:hypothetical protein